MAVLLLLLLLACKQPPPEPPPPVPVTVYTVTPTTVPALLQAVGTVQSSHMVDIRARVEGYLDSIVYTEGNRVHTGDLLFQIDPRPFQASLDSALAELARQKAILWDTTVIRNRLEPLFKEHAIAERDLDNAIAQELASQAMVEAAEANVRNAQLNLDYTTLTAPIDGITSEANYREGTLITSQMEKPLTTVSATDPMWVNFSIAENVLLEYDQEVKAGIIKDPPDQKFAIRVILADGSSYPYIGEVDLLQPFYEQSTGTLNVRTTFPNPDSLLKPNQFVQVSVEGATYIDAFIVPQQSVLQGAKGPFVYIVDPQGKAEIALVQLGPWWNSYWVIKGGLKPGDRVVVEGINRIQKGTPVKVS